MYSIQRSGDTSSGPVTLLKESDNGDKECTDVTMTGKPSTLTLKLHGHDAWGFWKITINGHDVVKSKNGPAGVPYNGHVTGDGWWLDGDQDWTDDKNGGAPSTLTLDIPSNLGLSLDVSSDSSTCTPSPPELVSQGKPTSMSSDGGYGAQGSSSNAVDGNTNTNWGGKSCTHTKKEHSPWWAVDLQSSYDVDSVKVYNRGDCCGSRLNDFGVKVGTAPNTGSECGAGNYKIGSGASKTVDCSGAQGSYVSIFMKKQVAIQICEVQVYGSASSEA